MSQIANFDSFNRTEWVKIRDLRSARKYYHAARVYKSEATRTRAIINICARGIAAPHGERSAFYTRLPTHFLRVSAVRQCSGTVSPTRTELNPRGAHGARRAPRTTKRRPEGDAPRAHHEAPPGGRTHPRARSATNFPGCPTT